MNETAIDRLILQPKITPPSGLQAARAVFRLSRLSMIKGRRGWLLGLLMLVPVIPAVVAQALQRGNRGTTGFVDVVANGYLAVLLPLLFLFLGCAAIGDEVEGRTITYLLIRPI